MPVKSTKSTKAAKTTKTVKAVKSAKTARPVKAVKVTKTIKTTKAVKTVKALKSAKAVRPNDEREANRMRQQRFLETHREEINEKRRERYAARKESGCCPRCGKKLRSLKSTLCKDCLEKARIYNQG